MQMQVVDGQQKVVPRDDAFGEDMPDFGKDLGMSQNISSLDQDTIEQQLVPAARDDLARGRQQLLATTILMGINRIIVTDGKINARIRFKFDAVEKRTTQSASRDLAQMGNTTTSQSSTQEQGAIDQSNGIWSSYKKTGDDYSYNAQSQTVTTPNLPATPETAPNADGTITAGGEMFGEVSINFRSDTCPLEKMVNTDKMMRLNEAQQGYRGTPGPGGKAAAGAAPAAGTTTAAATTAPATAGEGALMTGASSFPEVGSEVRTALARSQAFRGLPHAQQVQLESDLAKVTDIITTPAAAVARGLEDKQPRAPAVLKMHAAKAPGLVQDQIKATAV